MRLLSLTNRPPAQPLAAANPWKNMSSTQPAEFCRLIKQKRYAEAKEFLRPLLESIEKAMKEKPEGFSITLPFDLPKAEREAFLSAVACARKHNAKKARMGLVDSRQPGAFLSFFEPFGGIMDRMTNDMMSTFFLPPFLNAVFKPFGVDYYAELAKTTPEDVEKMRAKRAQA